MKNTFTQRIVLGTLALFLLGYVGLQIYRYTNSQYKTETANPYTVAESTKLTGIALRREILLDDFITGGVATYVTSDGSKVSPGTTLAEIYDSEEDIANIRTLRELENQRQLLEKAQDPGTTSFAHTDVLNKQIFSELGGIIDAVNRESLLELKTMSDKLLVLMNTKQIATGKQTDFNGAIEQLKAEEEYYRGKIEAEPDVIKAPQPGYFIRTIDGLEDKVDMDTLDELTPEELVKLINSNKISASKRVGKLMTSHLWYFAAVVTSDEASRYREGATVTLDFNISGQKPVPATVKYVNTKRDEPDAVVIFETDYISEALVNLRVTQVEVRFKSITGLRVSDSAIRFNGTQKGVYIVLGEKLVFRPITVIYEDVGFVLCWENDPEYMSGTVYTGLQQFDEVVIGGTQLYNDKRLK
ncbi:HlyD family efflux transporter periplasmic adaptor subunit [Anaerotruncus rubiinfantis]|uniref:HlyD family efflux transporter periplasmic adaptor subunit n=1 Tax=Anaerotruncus rubiinfantis TaxID=1720200 RepID=UPI00189BA90A|nr:HlyD family efflux transporter periplasmic adaptor subunit [Anaerotruncus rubiinfantis]